MLLNVSRTLNFFVIDDPKVNYTTKKIGSSLRYIDWHFFSKLITFYDSRNDKIMNA